MSEPPGPKERRKWEQYAANDAGGTGMSALHLTYTLGPGVSIGGQIASGTADGMEDVTQVLLGTTVGF